MGYKRELNGQQYDVVRYLGNIIFGWHLNNITFVLFCKPILYIFLGGELLEAWIGKVVGKMHLYKITQKYLAEYLGYSREYIAKILNGKRKPKGAKELITKAVDQIIADRGG